MKRILAFILLAVLLTGSLVMAACDTPSESSSDAETSGETEDSSAIGSDSKEESGEASSAESKEESDMEMNSDNIALGCPYFYEYGVEILGDDHLRALTNGKKGNVTLKPLSGKTDISLTSYDWGSKERTLNVDNTCAVISVDLGFLCEVNGFEISADASSCDVFYSTDGANFSFYAGSFGMKDSVSFTAKAVQFLIPYGKSKEINIEEIQITGKRENERILVSKGATYTVSGKTLSWCADDGTKLTDGILVADAGTDAATGYQGSERDPVTGKSGTVFTIDLGKNCNVSDVLIGQYIPGDRKMTVPDRITVRYSKDSETWEDLGQSYLRTLSGASDTASRLFFVPHAETVEARYIRVYTYSGSPFATDEIQVFGCEKAVKPDFDFIQRKNTNSNTNIVAYQKVSLNGAENALLTDCLYAANVNAASGANAIKADFTGSQSVCGACVTYTGKADKWQLLDDKGNEIPLTKTYALSTGSKIDCYLYCDAKETGSLTINFNGTNAKVNEVAVYASAPQLPVVRGGFFQLPCAGASTDNASNNSPYSWFLQLKGMKDLGMDYVVIQYGAQFSSKDTMINGSRIKAAGYRYTATYGSQDIIGAILDAADRLNMKVWLGTIHGADFNSPLTSDEVYNKIVEDGKKVIEDIHELYGSRKSFAGYYLSDEECDQWMNMAGGVTAARTIYKGQSDFIHEIDPESSIMIAPAIWRSGMPKVGADNLYRVLTNGEGKRPVVDIVAAQDCLGRLDSLTVDNGTFDSFESYCSEWAKAVRRAGAEFWHDTEVFEVTSTAKRATEVIKSVGNEAKMSGAIIVFDIPHYMTLFQSAAYDNIRSLYLMRETRGYAKYYADFAPIAKKSENAAEQKVCTDDGIKVAEIKDEIGKGEQKTQAYNAGVITDGKKLNWQKFVTANGANYPEYAYSFDNDAFYVHFKSHDNTRNYQKGIWWSGEDDLLQMWIITTGATAGDALDSEYGIRFWLHVKQNGWEQGFETSSSKTSPSSFSFTEDNGEFCIKMPWSALGIKAPKAKDGTAIAINLQYIDGEDLSWSSSTGNNGRALDTKALYSF